MPLSSRLRSRLPAWYGFTAAAACLAASTPALAQPDAGAGEPSSASTLSDTPAATAAAQQPIVVTATRTAQTADAALAPVIVITREQIERQPGAGVAELLRGEAGVQISRNGGPGQQTSIFLRGAESNHTLVMLDGVKLNPGTIGTAAIQNIDPSTIERIEVVKGPRSTLYGSDAIGGVINIITRRRHEEGTHYAASLSGGSQATRGASLSGFHREADKSAGLTLSAHASDGIPPRASSSEDRGYDRLSINAYGSKRMGESDLRISHFQAQGTTDYLGFSLEPLSQDYSNRVTALQVETPLSDAWASKLRVSRMVDDIAQNQSADFLKTTRDVLDWQHDLQLDAGQLLSAGIYLAHEAAAASVFGSGFDASTDVRALFVQDDLQRGAHRLVAGARYTDHSAFGDRTTWDLEYGFNATGTLRLTAAAQTGFRAPDATDRFGFGGDPNLRPETSRNAELGLRWQPTPGQRFTLDAFDNRIDDLIEYDYASSRLRNIASARIRGVEAAYAYDAQQWGADLGAVWQNPEDGSDGSQLLRRAKRTASLGAHARAGAYTLTGKVLYNGPRPDVGGVTLAAYTLVNLSLERRLGKHATLAARIENVTDADYRLADGYNTPGRAWFAELHYRFGGA